MSSFRVHAAIVCHVCHETFETRAALDGHWDIGHDENSEIARLQHENIELRTEKNELMTKLTAYRSSNQKKSRDNLVKNLEMEIESLRDKLSTLQERNVVLMKKSRNSRSGMPAGNPVSRRSFSGNKSEVNRYKQEMASKNRRIEELETKVKRLQRQVKEKDRTIKRNEHQRSPSASASPSHRSSVKSRSPSPFSLLDADLNMGSLSPRSPQSPGRPALSASASERARALAQKRKLIRTDSTTEKPSKRNMKGRRSPQPPGRRKSTSATQTPTKNQPRPKRRKSMGTRTNNSNQSAQASTLHARHIRKSQSEHPTSPKARNLKKRNSDLRIGHKPRISRSNSLNVGRLPLVDTVHPLGGSSFRHRLMSVEADYSSPSDNDEPDESMAAILEIKRQRAVLTAMQGCVHSLRTEMNGIRRVVESTMRLVDDGLTTKSIDKTEITIQTIERFDDEKEEEKMLELAYPRDISNHRTTINSATPISSGSSIRSLTATTIRTESLLSASRRDIVFDILDDQKELEEETSPNKPKKRKKLKKKQLHKRLIGVRKRLKKMRNKLRDHELYAATLVHRNSRLTQELRLDFCRIRVLERTCDMYREAVKLFKKRVSALHVPESHTNSVYFEDCQEV